MKTKIHALALGTTIVFTATAHAATITKAATGTDLNAGASWGGTVPSATDTATWAGSSLGTGLTLASAASWQGLKVTGAASDIDISGTATLTLGSEGISLAGRNLVLSNPIQLSGPQSWSAATGRTLNVSGAVSGSDPLTFGVAAQSLTSTTFLTTGPQTLFTGASLASVVSTSGKMGGGWVNGGNPKDALGYQLGNDGTTATYWLKVTDDVYTKAVKIQLNQVGADITAQALQAKYINGFNLAFDFETGGNGGTVANSQGDGGYGGHTTTLTLGYDTTGVVLLSGANTFTGPVILSRGTLRAGIASVAGVSGAFGLDAPVTIETFPSNVLDLNGYDTRIGSLTGGGSVLLGSGRLTLGGDNSSPAPYNGSISGTGGITKIGTGTQTIGTSAHSATGGIVVENGTLAFTGGAGFDVGTFATAQTYTVTGGTLEINGDWLTNSTSTYTINGGTLAFTKTAGDTTINYVNNLSLTNGTVAGPASFRTGNNTTATHQFAGDTGNLISAGIGLVKNGPAQTIVLNVADGAADADLTISGAIFDVTNLAGSTLSKTGPGKLVLTAANTYSGPTTVNGGTLKLGTGGSLDASSAITVAPGATFDVADTGFTLGTGRFLTAGDGSAGNDVIGSLISNGTIRPGGNGTLATISGITSLALGGTLDWDHNAGNSGCDSLAIQGTLTIAPGFAVIPKASGFPTEGTKSYTVVSGITSPLAAGDIANLPELPPTYAWNTSDPTALRISHTQPGAFLVWKGNINGNWDLATANWNSFPTAVYQDGDNCTFDDTATGGTTVEIAVDVSPGSILVNNSTARTYTFASAANAGITGAAQLLKTGTGTLILASSNIHTGGTTISEGVVAFGSGGISTAGPIVMNGGTLRWHDTNTDNISAAITMVDGKNAVFDTNGNDVVFTAGLGNSTSAGLVKTGSGSLTLNGTGSYTGTTEVLNGTLIAASNNALGGSTIVLGNSTNAATLMLANRADIPNPVTVSAAGSGTVTIGADNSGGGAESATYFGLLTLNRPTTINGAVLDDRLALNGRITGNVGTLTVTGGARTTLLSTLNDFVGNILITGAGSILQASVATPSEVIPDASNVTIENGAIFQLSSSGGAETINALSGDATATVRTHSTGFYGSGLVVGSADGSGTFAGTITNGTAGNPLSLTKSGAGTQTLSGINTYTGNTTVHAGTLELTAGARLTFRVTDTTSNTLTGAGTVTLNGEFAIDTSAVTTGTGPWLLENADTLTGAYGSTFKVVNPDGSPWTDAGNNKWTQPAAGGKVWTFNETTGTLTLGTGGFSSWADANAPGQTMAQDHDLDGVPNGIEYFMGLAGNAFTANPAPDAANKVSWPKGASYTGTYGTDYVVQTSTNLATWTDVPLAEVTNGNPLEYTIPKDAPARFTRLKVTGP